MKKLLVLLFSIFFSTSLLAGVSLTIDGKEIKGKDLKDAIIQIMPSEQKALHIYANKALNFNRSGDLTKVAKQQGWIDAQHELCNSSRFNAFKLKKDWIGRLRYFGLNSNADGSYRVSIAIHPDNTNFDQKYYSETQNRVTQSRINKKIFKSDVYDLRPGKIVRIKGGFFKKDTYEETGNLVRFSGYFVEEKTKSPRCLKHEDRQPGNMYGIGLFSNEWRFDFTKIEKISVREF